ncbi:HET-domain-containing protein, partial [Cadophora sp. DSE1049]
HKCDISSNTNSPAIMNWARDQIKSCRKDHSICQPYFISEKSRKFLPTRVLGVGKDHDLSIRLLVTSELPPTSRATMSYIALSHCWGKSHNVLLLQETFDGMKQSITVADLSANFRDAISITRKLGVPYLWIDSLCIIQNSPGNKDWFKESQTMGLVYARAICTISATASRDSEGGCFLNKESFLGHCNLREENDTSLVATLSDLREDTVVAELFRQKVEPAPLSTRGWTFQERILSSRILHFCDGLVLFECNTVQASSCHGDSESYPKKNHIRSDGKFQTPLGPTPPPRPPFPTLHLPEFRFADPLPSRNAVGKSYDSYKAYTSWTPQIPIVVDMSARLGIRGAFEVLIRFNAEGLEEKLEFHDCWYEIVERYSIRDLTKETDKLMAITGIAYFIAQNKDSTFVAGLWVLTLQFNLL